MPADTGDTPPADESPPFEELLLDAGVVEEHASDLRLTDDFAAAWRSRIDRMGDSDRAIRWVALSQDVDPDRVEITTDDGDVVLTVEGTPLGRWPSETAFLAATVAEPTLQEWLPASAWERLSAAERAELAGRLLIFLDRCPTCDTTLDLQEEITDETVSVMLVCPACDATLFAGTHDQTADQPDTD